MIFMPLHKQRRSGAKQKLESSQEAQFKEAVLRLQAQRSGGRATGHDVKNGSCGVPH
ncbi:hypothetical protein [Methyloglobulus sp.]|uniref:hypothetical protein n=1 Tax=Methyloglobulus sp. TaxID=2518622 RepID=UPI0032B82315